MLVVGNPCNTNCLIAAQRTRRTGRPVVRDDAARREPRPTQLAQKAGVPWRTVTNMTIWGNHSATQFPDYAHARIGGSPATDVITDTAGSRASSSRPCRSAARR